MDMCHTQLHPQLCGLRRQAEWDRSHAERRKHKSKTHTSLWCSLCSENHLRTSQHLQRWRFNQQPQSKWARKMCTNWNRMFKRKVGVYWAPPTTILLSYLLSDQSVTDLNTALIIKWMKITRALVCALRVLTNSFFRGDCMVNIGNDSVRWMCCKLLLSYCNIH